MSRKPIQIELKGLKTPRERVWEAVLALEANDRPFTKADVFTQCTPPVTQSCIKDYLEELSKGGWLKKVGGNGSGPGLAATPIEFRVQKRHGEAPRVSTNGDKVTQGGGVDAMWRAMKVLPVFDYTDIAKAATLGDLIVKPGTAKAYVVALARAGYLTPVRAAKPGVPARHRLSKNTGMYAPAITRLKVVFDRNTGAAHQMQSAQEVCDGLE